MFSFCCWQSLAVLFFLTPHHTQRLMELVDYWKVPSTQDLSVLREFGQRFESACLHTGDIPWTLPGNINNTNIIEVLSIPPKLKTRQLLCPGLNMAGNWRPETDSQGFRAFQTCLLGLEEHTRWAGFDLSDWNYVIAFIMNPLLHLFVCVLLLTLSSSQIIQFILMRLLDSTHIS